MFISTFPNWHGVFQSCGCFLWQLYWERIIPDWNKQPVVVGYWKLEGMFKVTLSIFLRLYCIAFLPFSQNLLAKAYHNIINWLKPCGRNCYIWDILLTLNTNCMWLLCNSVTQNSMGIGVKVISGLNNVCWDYAAITIADFQPIEIFVRHMWYNTSKGGPVVSEDQNWLFAMF